MDATLTIGGISTLDSAATRRALDARFQESDEEAARRSDVEQLTSAYTRAVQSCDAAALALFAPRKTFRAGSPDKVTPTVAEVVADSLDARDFMQRAMQVLLLAAAGRGCQRDAQQLLAEAGAHWADSEADFL